MENLALLPVRNLALWRARWYPVCVTIRPTGFIRATLWASAAFNVVAGLAFVFPATLGAAFGLPSPGTGHVYPLFVALFVLLFAGLYAWLARRSVISRQIVGFAAIGKACAFVLTVLLFAVGELPPRALGGAIFDLGFALAFTYWLRESAISARV